jgi:shikimate 5-dehydrogenase
VVIGFGATARGAVTALNALGVHDVDVLTHREVAAVAAPIHSTRIVHFDTDDTAARVSHAVTESGRVRLAEFLVEHDIIVNCVLQDTDAPLTFMTETLRTEQAPLSNVLTKAMVPGAPHVPTQRRSALRALLRRRPQSMYL